MLNTARFIRKGCLSWERYPGKLQQILWRVNKFVGWRSDSGWLLLCRLTTLYVWQGNLVCASQRPSDACWQPCTTLLSGLLAPGVPAHVVKSICLSCQADASPQYDPGFLWKRRKLVWVGVLKTGELKCWLLLTYHTENMHCLSLEPSKIPGLSRWLITPILWGHSLGLTLTSCMTSVAEGLHHFQEQFWGALKMKNWITRAGPNSKTSESCHHHWWLRQE